MASSTTGMRAFALAIFLALLVTTASARSRKNGGSSNTSGQSRNSEIKAELNNMMNNITKTHPKYVGDLKKAIQTISFALDSGYDYSGLLDATILLGTDAANVKMNQVIPAKRRNIPLLYNVTAYHIITRRLTYAKIKAMPPGPLPTQLGNEQPIYKMTKAGSRKVSFGKGKKYPASTWTTIIDPTMYTGKFFITHGVDTMEIPEGTNP
eukprot:TRINITY_DN1866_c0_g1_i2.p1 TRINITY_DN1866_c0_g1~~TRINITY_DN1866_c0_g1_i2.p1  ORF type:complete len:209 (+),score=24.97 TRINITY_DN1866_c0_g1_i2:157-783(+)